ncbi:DUF3313 domain-containing protein [Candidatus Litorirhabdus singularis]|uniref:DUF3313 domain-containing protein n=1 Tax=Candidatus Litorirhabdus singularis TaxID=2518993 RepID=UPI00242F4699|nr:DUF3313 domain-containing protein [Candidatus Litorirhabdus singularis]
MKSVLILLLACTLLAGCSFSDHRLRTLTESRLGFIGDYSNFEAFDAADGMTAYRYASPKLRSGYYRGVILEAVDFYPERTQVTDLDADLLKQVKDYIDRGLAASFQGRINAVNESGHGVFVMVPRITSVSRTFGDIKARELVPVGAALAAARSAAGLRHQNIEFYMELKIIDSLTGELIGGSIKQGKGREISGRAVTFEDIKPLLDVWVLDANEAFGRLQEASRQHLPPSPVVLPEN